MNGSNGRIGMTRGFVAGGLVMAALSATSTGAFGQSGCGDCGGLPPRLQAQIGRMQSAPISFTRDAAAHDLQAYDWRQYPQILDALCTTMLSDPIAHVRSEAAQTLHSIQPVPCVPEVRSALARAVASERNPFARSWMRKAMARVEQNCGPMSSGGGCSPCDAGQSIPAALPMGGGEPVLLDPVPLETSVREPQVQRAQAIQVQPQAKVRSRPRPSEIPQEAPLDLQPEFPPTRGPAPEAEPALSPAVRGSQPLDEPELTPTTRRAPAPPAPAPVPARQTAPTDLFGKLPPISDIPADSGDPLPEKLPRLSEPDLTPPAPPAEAAGPFGRAAQSDNRQPGQKRDRFASNSTTRRTAPQPQATSYQAKPTDNGPIIGDVVLPEPTLERRRAQPLRIFQRPGR